MTSDQVREMLKVLQEFGVEEAQVDGFYVKFDRRNASQPLLPLNDEPHEERVERIKREAERVLKEESELETWST